jgi:hypothetical protein
MDNKNQNNFFSDVELSLDKTLIESDLEKLGDKFSEIVLGQLLDEKLLKDIPVLGILVKIGDFAKSFSGLMLQKKLLYFLQNISKISPEKRRTQIIKINADSKYRAKVGESILLLIEKHDSYERPILLANAFRAFLLEEISYDTFLDLAHVIDKIRLSTIDELKTIFAKQRWHVNQRSENNSHFESLGLISQIFIVPNIRSITTGIGMVGKRSNERDQEFILKEFAEGIKLEYGGNRLGDIFVRSVLS